MENTANSRLNVVFADSHLGVNGEGFEYIFSYQHGGPVSLLNGKKEWLYRAPRPALWRALTDNDRGNRFHLKSGVWLSADAFINIKGITVCVDGNEIPFPIAPENNKYTGDEKADEIKITYVFETITGPATNVYVSYTVYADGHILIKSKFEGKEGLPELPVFGLRFIIPTAACGYKYEGLSGETYPDRKAGGIKGIYDIEGLPMPGYLVPQDCGMHMDTDWVEISRKTTLNNADRDNLKENSDSFSLRIEKDAEPFAFSCLPYTPMELESATHAEELPPVRRTVLTIYGAVRGVGGIDSWGADVEAPYHIDASKDIEFSFVLR